MAITTQIIAIQAAWTTLINEINDPLKQAEAFLALQRYADALSAQSTAESSGVLSYSIAGRTVSRNNPTDSRNAINSLKRELYNIVYGGGRTIVDLSTVGDF